MIFSVTSFEVNTLIKLITLISPKINGTESGSSGDLIRSNMLLRATVDNRDLQILSGMINRITNWPDKNCQFREYKKLIIEMEKINYLIETDHL